MSHTDGSPGDRIIDAIKQLNAGYSNTEYAKRSPEDLGAGKLYTVVFKGADQQWRENYVFERGDKVKAYYTIREALRDSFTGIIPMWRDQEFIKLLVVAILTAAFATAVIGIVVWDPDNKSLQVLTGLLGLTLGYFVGKGDTPSR